MKAKETLREAQFEAELEEAEAQRLEEEVLCPHSRIPLFLYYYFYFKSIYLIVLLLPRYLFLFRFYYFVVYPMPVVGAMYIAVA